MEDQKIPIPLPPDYNENALFLLMQSPNVLYAYWEISPGLKAALIGKKEVQIRLNIEGKGPYLTAAIDLSQKSYYFKNVEPGHSYNCEIGIYNSGNQFYPFLRSNTVNAPHDRPSGGGFTETSVHKSSHVFNVSSWTLYSDKK